MVFVKMPVTTQEVVSGLRSRSINDASEMLDRFIAQKIAAANATPATAPTGPHEPTEAMLDAAGVALGHSNQESEDVLRWARDNIRRAYRAMEAARESALLADVELELRRTDEINQPWVPGYRAALKWVRERLKAGAR